MIDSYAKRFPKAVQCLEDGLEDSLAFYAFPMLDARKISSSNMIERLNREIRRRTSVIGIFPNESSYVRLETAYLMEYAEDWSVSRAYISPVSYTHLNPFLWRQHRIIKLRLLAQAPVALPRRFAVILCADVVPTFCNTQSIAAKPRLISTQNSSQIALVQLCGVT